MATQSHSEALVLKKPACVAHYNHESLPQRVLANRATRVEAPDNASITFGGSGTRLSGTSLDVMDNVGCPYGTLGLEGERNQIITN